MTDQRALPILLLPGLDGTGELLRALASQLAARRSVDLVDYPLDRWLSYSELVTYVVDRAPRRPFVILGESYSGPIAIEIAKVDPRVAGLVLASSFVRHPLQSQLAHLVWALDLKWIPGPIIASALMGRWSTAEHGSQLKSVLARLPREIVQGRVRDALRVDKRDELRRTLCPLLCLHGRQDRLIGKKSVNEIIDARPDGKLQWLDAPHMLLTTHAEAAAVIIDGFCIGLENRQG